MIDSFKWCVCFVLILALQCLLSPMLTIAADETQVGGAESESVSSVNGDLPEASVQNNPSRATDGLQDTSSEQKDEGLRRVALGSDVSREQTLSKLIGMSEITVLADVGGQFVSNMAENQIMEDEFASSVDEASLYESIKDGRAYNRESLAALARIKQAEAQSGQTRGRLLPSVSVRANRGYEKSEPSVIVDDATGELVASSTHIRSDVALTITQPLFDLTSFRDWRRSKVKEQASEENYRISDGDAFTSIVNAYLALVSTRLQADVAREFESHLSELLKYIEKRADAGAASISDMARVRARSEATLSARLELEAAHRGAGTEFVRLTNLVPDKVRLPELEDVGISVLPKSFEMAVATAMESNPEIASLSAEVEAEKINQSASMGRFAPRIDAEYTDTYSLHAGGSDTSQRDRRIMMVLNWNLLSGGKDYNYYLERTERHKELRYRLDDQRRRVVQALSANYATLTATSQRISSGYLELESISTAAEAMSKRMLSGNQSLLDLLDVLNQSFQVRSRLVDLHVLEMNTVAQLVRLTLGTPWPAPEETFSSVEQSQNMPKATEDH